MSKINDLFEDLTEVNDIIEKSDDAVQTALALANNDAAKAVVILCLALAKTCTLAKTPAKTMIESVLEMEETYLLEEENGLDSDLDSN